jgi:hypothetical protein
VVRILTRAAAERGGAGREGGTRLRDGGRGKRVHSLELEKKKEEKNPHIDNGRKPQIEEVRVHKVIFQQACEPRVI